MVLVHGIEPYFSIIKNNNNNHILNKKIFIYIQQPTENAVNLLNISFIFLKINQIEANAQVILIW